MWNSKAARCLASLTKPRSGVVNIVGTQRFSPEYISGFGSIMYGREGKMNRKPSWIVMRQEQDSLNHAVFQNFGEPGSIVPSCCAGNADVSRWAALRGL